MNPRLLTLTAAALGVLALAQAPTTPGNIFQATLGETDAKTPEVSTEQLRAVLNDHSALVLDARPHLEWATGHIPGALNVAARPGVAASEYVSDVAEVIRLVQGDKSRALILYCNGPFCGKSRRLSEELLANGFTSVRRYQLGAPVWSALGGVMVTEPDGARYIYQGDRTAWWVDAREAQDFRAGSLDGARNIPLSDVVKAKDDGRLPMNDHNTRVIVFGADGVQARRVAEELAKNAFHNISFFGGSLTQLQDTLMRGPERKLAASCPSLGIHPCPVTPTP